MKLQTEAVFWQRLGAVAALGGAFLLVHTVSSYGMASSEPRAIEYGLAGSFILLAGVLGFVTGRGLHAEQTGMKHLESFLLVVFAIAAIVGGAVPVVAAKVVGLKLLLMDRLIMGFVGAFGIMLGLVALLGQRLMCHMHDLGGHAETEPTSGEKARAAAAN